MSIYDINNNIPSKPEGFIRFLLLFIRFLLLSPYRTQKQKIENGIDFFVSEFFLFFVSEFFLFFVSEFLQKLRSKKKKFCKNSEAKKQNVSGPPGNLPYKPLGFYGKRSNKRSKPVRAPLRGVFVKNSETKNRKREKKQ
jgi:hypothetical protein